MTRLFGTNGIRGIVGETMTSDLAVRVGRALGTHWGPGTVALARDTRLSGPMLSRAVAAGLMSAGIEVLDLGVMPTPAAQYYVHTTKGLKGAVVVTASHNPREFNGLKAIDGRGMEMAREEEESIERVYFEERYASADWAAIGGIRPEPGGIERYLEAIQSRVDVEAIRKRAFTVGVDPGNGAGCLTSPYLLRSLGCRVVTIHGQPDGAFPGRFPEPTAEHLVDLQRMVPQVHADFGVAHDGDADRAIFIDETGSFLMGDLTLALLARAALARTPGLVVTPVSTSSLIDDVVGAAGGRVLRTRVGSPIVARTMLDQGAVFGGEENGGVIFPEHQFCRDGGMALAKILELLARGDVSLSKLVAGLPRYSLEKAAVEVPTAQRDEVLAGIVQLVKGRKVETIDGVKIHADDGAVLVRPSGTEPLFRIYAEARTPARAKALAAEGIEIVRKALSQGASRARTTPG